MKRIGVTGSGGFIGRKLVQALQDAKYEAVEISRTTNYDISQWQSIKEVPVCDVIVHLASRTFVPDSFTNPRDFYRFNFLATVNALELARRDKASFIHMSSYIYGAPQYIPVDEMHPVAPHNPYAQTKLISEELCTAYARDFNVSSTSFRLFNLYGPGQEGSLLIPEIIQQAQTGKVILKDPRPKRDYIHVDDVVQAVMLAIEKPASGHRILNLGTGISTTIQDLVAYILEASPKKFELSFTNEQRKGEVLNSVASTRKIEAELGWKAQISLREGIKSLF